MGDMSLDEKVQRSLDYQEIHNVMAAHSYYYEAQRQWEELDTIWSKRDDIAYGTHHIDKSMVDGSKPFQGRTAFKVSPPPEAGEMMAGPEPYSAKRVAKFEPALPKPYDSWDDSMSCVAK